MKLVSTICCRTGLILPAEGSKGLWLAREVQRWKLQRTVAGRFNNCSLTCQNCLPHFHLPFLCAEWQVEIPAPSKPGGLLSHTGTAYFQSLPFFPLQDFYTYILSHQLANTPQITRYNYLYSKLQSPRLTPLYLSLPCQCLMLNAV